MTCSGGHMTCSGGHMTCSGGHMTCSGGHMTCSGTGSQRTCSTKYSQVTVAFRE